jgi:DNA-binding CsgD family transcriptional regulator
LSNRPNPSLWTRLLARLRARRQPAPGPAPTRPIAFELTNGLSGELHNLSEHEQRPLDEVAAGLIAQALASQRPSDGPEQRWRSLSPREQEVAALICLHYTSPEIAGRLNISYETVKTHVRNILLKFHLHTRSELRRYLQEWDFSDWE